MYRVIFKHPEQSCIVPPLILALNQVCNDYGKDAVCVAGYRDLKTQKATNALVLATRKGSYQISNGAVYTGYGKDRLCWASAYGESNHCFCICGDMDGWMELLTNEQLKPYGLVKPMKHEPWHITLIGLASISRAQKEAIRDSCLKGASINMEVIDFQVLTGLQADGIAGPKTKEKAKEVLQFCQGLLGNNFDTDQKTINDILKRMGGKDL